MNYIKISLVIGACFLAACAQEPDASATAAGDQGSDTAAAAPDAAAAQSAAGLAQGDPDRGMRVFIQCQACHTTEPGAPHKLGPNLGALAGKAAATADGYVYSPALAESGIVWDAATLDKWIARPSDLVPGTTMVFAGIPDADARANLIAYLFKVTAE
jgi:cytochrome c